jgi:hypothetical protein
MAADAQMYFSPDIPNSKCCSTGGPMKWYMKHLRKPWYVAGMVIGTLMCVGIPIVGWVIIAFGWLSYFADLRKLDQFSPLENHQQHRNDEPWQCAFASDAFETNAPDPQDTNAADNPRITPTDVAAGPFPSDRQYTRESSNITETTRCPRCNADIPGDNSFCGRCGARRI